MRTHKRLLWAVIALLLLGAAFPTGQPAPPASAQDTALTIWADPALYEPLGQIIREFEASTGIDVVLQGRNQDEIVEWFTNSDDPGAGPDIFWVAAGRIDPQRLKPSIACCSGRRLQQGWSR